MQEPERRLRRQLAAVRVQALEPDVEQRCVPRHERLDVLERRIRGDAGGDAVRQPGGCHAVLLRRRVAAEHAGVRLHLEAVVRLVAQVAIRRRDEAAGIREPLVAGTGPPRFVLTSPVLPSSVNVVSSCAVAGLAAAVAP